MTDDEAAAEPAGRWRLTAALYLRHGNLGAVFDGATMGETPAALRAAAHALLDRMLDRLAAKVPGAEAD